MGLIRGNHAGENKGNRFSQKELLERNADVIEAMQDYKNKSQAEQLAAKELILKKLEGTIKMYISKNTPYYNYDVLYNQAVVVILEHIEEYNPLLNMPTTFFAPYIAQGKREGTQQEAYGSAPNTHYITILEQIDTALIERGLGSIHDVADEKIAAITGLSIKSVANARKYLNSTVSSYECLETDIEDPLYSTPEDIAIAKERDDSVSTAVARGLNKLEQFVVQAIYYDTNNDSEIKYSQIAEAINKSGLMDKNCTSSDVIELQAKVLTKLRRSKYLKHWDSKNTGDDEFIKINENDSLQITSEDLDDAITNDYDYFFGGLDDAIETLDEISEGLKNGK